MQGEKLTQRSGKVTGRRVLPSGSGRTRVEVSFEMKGATLGVESWGLGTYETVSRADGSLLGKGQGILMGRGGERARWTGDGVGKVHEDGRTSFRGAIYYETDASAWKRLNSVAAIFEYEEDAEGNARTEEWEWR